MKISWKKLLATALIVTTALTMFGVSRIELKADIIEEDYARIQGVLYSDTYELYPYAQSSMDIGFSKYGEMITYDEDTGIGLGIQYPGYDEVGTYNQDVKTEVSVDVFCNEKIEVDLWINGWFIDIKYLRVGAAETTWREIWAFALFSDGALHGHDWITMPEVEEDDKARPLWQEYPPYANPDSDLYPSPKPPYGGRKTNGVCETDPITVVYNGPRRFIALLKTRVKDGVTELVDVIFTIIFNKAEKNVIILKDIKRLYGKRPMNIAFGNRGEWDLSPPAYVHFYTDEPVQSWDVNGDGNIAFDEGHEFFYQYFRENKYPKKWWQDVSPQDWPETIEGEPFEDAAEEWFETQYTCYGREWHWDENIKDHGYAVAQVVDADAEWVGAMAVWPHPEFWSADYLFTNPNTPPEGVPLMFKPLTRCIEWNRWTVVKDPEQGSFDKPEGILKDREDIWVKLDDMYREPGIPWLVYEHDFRLQMDVMDEYRIVTVYTLTDYHDADDADAPDLNENGIAENKIDREIQYQLDEIFRPWDIWDTMHKATKRWVEIFEHAWYWDGKEWVEKDWDGETYNCVKLPEYKDVDDGMENGTVIDTLPVLTSFVDLQAYLAVMENPDLMRYSNILRTLEWDSYCSFAERVLVDTGEGFELIPRYGYHMLDPVRIDPDDLEEGDTYYEIDPNTGEICFWEYDEELEEFVEWYLPEDSVVKVLWSTAQFETDAEEWWWYDLEDKDQTEFPLHQSWPHIMKDITGYPYAPEVFLVDQPPERLFEGIDYGVKLSERITVEGELLAIAEVGVDVVARFPDGIPMGTRFQLAHPFVEGVLAVYADGLKLLEDTDYRVEYCVDGRLTRITMLKEIFIYYNLTCDYRYWSPATVTLYEPPPYWECKELDIKYHIPWSPCGMGSTWVEDKRHIDDVPRPGPMDLAFVIDDTGSMWDELSGFQAALDEILDAADAWSGGDIRYSLVVFSDTVRVVQDWTTNRATVEAAIMGLTGSGGAGWPEASDEALNTTVNELSAAEAPCQTGNFSAWRNNVLGVPVQKRLIIFTDAEPGGCDDIYQPSDLTNGKTWAAMAATKGIVISSIEGDTTSYPEVTTEALQFYAEVTGGVYVKIDGIDIAEAVIAAFKGLTFTLTYPTDYVEKVWHHSEKAITDGFYVCYGKTITLQDPLPWNEWLWIEYKYSGISRTDYFCGDGTTTQFDLYREPDYGTLHVYNTYVIEEILSGGDTPGDGCIRLPDKDWYPAFADEMPASFHYADWITYGILTEKEWLCKDDEKIRGNYVIHETDTCAELVLDQPLEPWQVLKIVYTVISGRYEWTTVGRDAHSVDSIGAALVTAAFKNKKIEIGTAGMDMMFTEDDISSVPYIMRCLGTAPGTRSDYKDDGTTPGDRTSLKDDWCETWPVASSNIIGVGGPLANLFSLYLNDFTSAFYGNDCTLYDEEYTPNDPWKGSLIALTCWNRTAYRSSGDLGYATIGTYKDKNGTIGLVIWGIRGRDTFYASKWFEQNKYTLQHINPHVTSIVLEIDYEDPEHPEFEVVEFLGTISEKPQHDC